MLCCGAFTFEPQRRGAVEAVLEVNIAGQGPSPGLAAATYRVVLTGPSLFEVTSLRLEDAAGGWKTTRQSSAWSEEDARAVVEILLVLQQVKRDEPLPNLHIGFREGPEAPAQEVEWLDILRSARFGPGPPPPAEPQTSPWVVAAILGAIVLLTLGGALWWWRRRRDVVPVEPWVRALAEIDRLEREGPARGAAAYHTQLSQAVRIYVAERFGLRALEKTTAEFLAAAGAIPELAGQEETLRAFCERCDLAKFADAAMTPEECRSSGELARALIEATRSVAPADIPVGT
jgi:hypothetical protein